MEKKQSNYTKKVGLPPESLIYTGNQEPSTAEMEILVYDEKGCERHQTGDINKMAEAIDEDKINLIIISNLTDVTLIENIGKFFTIHPMMLEDVLNTAHPPKTEEYGDQLMITLKLLEYHSDRGLLQQHVSLILGTYYVIVFKDFENKVFEDIKTRILNGKSKARQKKADYLFYILIDTLVDTIYNVVNELNKNIDTTEVQLLEKPENNHIRSIYGIKQTMSDMRGVIYPIREALLNIVQGDYSLIEDGTITYMHDVKDHINHIIQMYESGRDTLSDLIELNSSNISNRLNRSMQFMTIITTLFIPLTLIAGIYGMNFKHMPEINWKAGYPFSILLMIITAGIMYYIIKRKKLL